MVDSRLRLNPPSIFHCFVCIAAPQEGEASYVQKSFPEDFEEKESILKGISAFCFPCANSYDGVQYSTFVLTDLDSKFRFGFCRYPPRAKHCLCIVSYFPWFHTFYGVLDKVAQINNNTNFKGVSQFLEALDEQPIPSHGSKLYFHFNDDDTTQSFKITIPDTTKLPSIPDNRNLTEYFAKVTPENMVSLFISMLFERRIIICSEKLSVLTAVVHGSVSLLYPMQWQHIYIPILPTHLIDYCCAPMPFLLGVHASMMEKVRKMPLSEVVIFDADANEMTMMPEDSQIFPSKIASKLKRKLRHLDRALDDYVSRQFLNSLADIMGGYRDALKFLETDDGPKIVFDDELFLNSRTGSVRVFLENILNLQSFRQFIAGRLEKLNDDEALDGDMFEKTINQRSLEGETKYSHLKDKMRKGGGAIKKGGVALKKTVDGSVGQLKVMAHDIDTKEIKKKIKDKVKDVKDIMQMGQKDAYGDIKDKPNRKTWSPNLMRTLPRTGSPSSRTGSPSSQTGSASSQTGSPSPLVKPRVINTNGQPPSRRPPPPPRPPRPASELFYRQKALEPMEPPSHSENDIPTLLDLSGDGDAQDNISGTLSYGTSDTDSSTERSEEGFENPGFDPTTPTTTTAPTNYLINLQSSSPAEEDLLFEHTPISPPRGYTPPPLFNENHSDRNSTAGVAISYQNPVMKKFENNELFYNPTANLIDYSEKDPAKERTPPPSITRKRYVSGKKPVVPPRPRAQTSGPPDKPPIPSRPPSLKKRNQEQTGEETRDLIFESDSSGNSYLADLSFEDSTPELRAVPPVTTTPELRPIPPGSASLSADLLGLEQSLFHETMKSMSDDTRTLFTLTDSTTREQPRDAPRDQPRDQPHVNNSLSNNMRDSITFFEKSDFVPNYANVGDFNANSSSRAAIVNSKVVNSTSSRDPFANCLEEAKNIKYIPR